MACQQATGYGRRSLAETGIGRDKAAIGPQLQARTLPTQQGEAAIAVAVLTRMIQDCQAGLGQGSCDGGSDRGMLTSLASVQQRQA